MADLQGVDESDIRRMGRWNNSSINGAYLTGLPRGIMRSLAGFPQQGTFFLPRNTTIPSKSLQAKVFPEASLWLSKIHEGHAEQTVSAEDEEYLSFKRQLIASSQAEENQETTMLKRVIPLVERKLANIEDASRIAYESLSRQIGSIFEKISDNISTGRAPLQINIEWPQGGSDSRPLVSTTALTASTSTSAQESSASLGQPSSTPNNAAVEQNTPSLAPTTYRMSTGVHTVTDLYREWTEGLGGNYSVQYMNANYTGWYSKQKSFYMRRRKIIKACEKYAAVEGWTIDNAVRRAETLRVRNKKSLDYVLCCMQSLRSPACA